MRVFEDSNLRWLVGKKRTGRKRWVMVDLKTGSDDVTMETLGRGLLCLWERAALYEVSILTDADFYQISFGCGSVGIDHGLEVWI